MAIKKYGKQNFKRTIIKEFDNPEQAFLYQSELVTQQKVDDKMCYNCGIGGLGGPMFLNKHHTYTTKIKLSQAFKGKSFITQQGRKKISQKNKLRIISECTRERLSKSTIERMENPEERKKISDSIKYMYKEGLYNNMLQNYGRKPKSQQVKKKISNSRRGKHIGIPQTNEHKSKISKSIKLHNQQNKRNGISTPSSIRGRKCINNGIVIKYIAENQIPYYINGGWNLGKLK